MGWVKTEIRKCFNMIMVVVYLLSHVRLLWPHGLYPARLLSPWDSPGKHIGVDCHFPLQDIFPIHWLNPLSCIAGRFFTNWATEKALIWLQRRENQEISTRQLEKKKKKKKSSIISLSMRPFWKLRESSICPLSGVIILTLSTLSHKTDFVIYFTT